MVGELFEKISWQSVNHLMTFISIDAAAALTQSSIVICQDFQPFRPGSLREFALRIMSTYLSWQNYS